jgi:hypothetical protein
MFHRSNNRIGVLPILHTLRGRVVDENNRGVANVALRLNSGQVAMTDAEGDYIFGSLPPGNYTATPTYQNHRFQPASRTIDLFTNRAMDNFVMREPVYDIQGKVLQANNSPLAGVTMRLEPGSTVRTGTDGTFSFDNQQPGQYTLTPANPALTYVPSRRSVVAEEEIFQTFYALPKPVAGTLLPNSSTEIEFADTQGLPTRIIFPEGLGNEEAVVTPLLLGDINGYLVAGHALEVVLGNANASTQSGIAGNDALPSALIIEIQYSQADLQRLLDANELVLLWQSPQGWVEALSTCPEGEEVVHNRSSRTLRTPVCEWGTYALAAPVSRLYMPSLFGNSE